MIIKGLRPEPPDRARNLDIGAGPDAGGGTGHLRGGGYEVERREEIGWGKANGAVNAGAVDGPFC